MWRGGAHAWLTLRLYTWMERDKASHQFNQSAAYTPTRTLPSRPPYRVLNLPWLATGVQTTAVSSLWTIHMQRKYEQGCQVRHSFIMWVMDPIIDFPFFMLGDEVGDYIEDLEDCTLIGSVWRLVWYQYRYSYWYYAIRCLIIIKVVIFVMAS